MRSRDRLVVEGMIDRTYRVSTNQYFLVSGTRIVFSRTLWCDGVFYKYANKNKKIEIQHEVNFSYTSIRHCRGPTRRSPYRLPNQSVMRSVKLSCVYHTTAVHAFTWSVVHNWSTKYVPYIGA
uniref:Uncharacterized protein n=1 Tax=Sipha flava TaxID=143950 RepID=A0A2S2QTT1_9HEMI